MIEIFLRSWSLPDSSLDPGLPPPSPLGGFPGQRSHTATPPRPVSCWFLASGWRFWGVGIGEGRGLVALCWVPACCAVGGQVASGSADFTLLAGTQDGIFEVLK